MRPVVDWARAETENTSSVKVVNSNREAAVIRPSEDEAALTLLDSIGTPPCFWSDSHTTIGETVSSKFNFWIGSVNNVIGPDRSWHSGKVPYEETHTRGQCVRGLHHWRAV